MFIMKVLTNLKFLYMYFGLYFFITGVVSNLKTYIGVKIL
jgi:hypothetical protein